MAQHQPKRVLHILGRMARGGVETWLMHALRNADPRRVRMDFLVHTIEPAAYDAEIESRSARILRVTAPRRSPAYARAIARSVSGYDAVHSHVHHFSGFLLWLAKRAGVSVRIAHSHSDTGREDARASLCRRLYLRSTERALRGAATHMVAASKAAGHALYGDAWDADPRRRLLRCGIDLTPFRALVSRDAIRRSLGIGTTDVVIGHAGRFCTPKNHGFLVEIAAEVFRSEPRTKLLLVGDGPERPAIEQRVRALGLAGRTIFTGVRADVPELLRAMDVFLFPSLWEGVPLTVIEAQAAGLPCVISDVISEETAVTPGLIRRASLNAGPDIWAAAVLAAAHTPRLHPDAALSALQHTSFNIQRSLEELYALYSA